MKLIQLLASYPVHRHRPPKIFKRDGLRLAMRRFDPDQGLVVTLNQSETMHVPEGGIEFLPYRRWALEVARWCG